MPRTPLAALVAMSLLIPGRSALGQEAAGSLVGRVRFTGTPPPATKVEVHQDVEVCGAHHPIAAEDLVVSAAGGLANVVLVLEGAPAGAPGKAAAAELRQSNCTFAPHVQAVRAGATLDITNDDPVLHNVHGLIDGRTVFNLAMPRRGLRVKRTLDTPGVIAIRCDSGHTWMSAYVVVVPDRFHAVTDADGAFAIPAVPPGTYTLRAWHERLGWLEQRVDVAPGAESAVTFTYRDGKEAAKRPAEPPSSPPPAAPAASGEAVREERRDRIAREGRPLYLRYCATCHGRSGQGDGPTAASLDTPPRDFTSGEYKFRMTPAGSGARALDVYRTISLGVPGTAMPAWKGRLARADRLLLAEYALALSPFIPPGAPIEIPPETPSDAASVARGGKLYREARCDRCHGASGHGDGRARRTLRDDLGRPIAPYDLTRGFFGGGRGAAVVYRAISTGLAGTPMPSFADTLTPEERWDLAHFVQSLAKERGAADYLFGDEPGRIAEP